MAENLWGEWQKWLAEPKNNAAFLQFGLQMMQPMSPGQTAAGHFAQSVGEGFEAAERIRASELEEELKREELARKRQEGEGRLEDKDLDRAFKREQLEETRARRGVFQQQADTARYRAAPQAQRDIANLSAIAARTRHYENIDKAAQERNRLFEQNIARMSEADKARARESEAKRKDTEDRAFAQFVQRYAKEASESGRDILSNQHFPQYIGKDAFAIADAWMSDPETYRKLREQFGLETNDLRGRGGPSIVVPPAVEERISGKPTPTPDTLSVTPKPAPQPAPAQEPGKGVSSWFRPSSPAPQAAPVGPFGMPLPQPAKTFEERAPTAVPPQAQAAEERSTVKVGEKKPSAQEWFNTNRGRVNQLMFFEKGQGPAARHAVDQDFAKARQLVSDPENFDRLVEETRRKQGISTQTEAAPVPTTAVDEREPLPSATDNRPTLAQRMNELVDVGGGQKVTIRQAMQSWAQKLKSQDPAEREQAKRFFEKIATTVKGGREAVDVIMRTSGVQ